MSEWREVKRLPKNHYLKRCPCCESKAVLETDGVFHMVRCGNPNCIASPATTMDGIFKVINDWNTGKVGAE